MKYTKWNEDKLEEFFENNFIEDEELFNYLKDKEAVLEMDTNEELDCNKETELTIKLKMKCA